MSLRRLALALAVVLAPGCDDDPTVPGNRPFHQGTDDDPRIGLVVSSLESSLRLFQLGAPDETRVVPLGASASVTPTGLAVHGGSVAVPLGNAASVALIDPAEQRIDRFFLFPSGNATGAAFTADGALLVANLIDDQVGRATLDQASDQITATVAVAPGPTDIEVAGGRALVLSGNLDESFQPLGPGIVTVLDPTTLEVLGTVETGGTNPGDAAVGPDGLLYVVNTGDFVGAGSLAVIDPSTLELLDVMEGFGVGPGSITVDADGLAYVSGFFFGTLVFDTRTRAFVRGPDNPVCAPLAGGGCRGAFDAISDGAGRLYQAFFGSPSEGLPPWIFVYEAGSWALADSVASGSGTAAIRIGTF